MSVQPTVVSDSSAIADGSHRIKVDYIYPRQYVMFAFYSDEDQTTPVNPTAGTITFTARVLGGTQFISPPNNARSATSQSFLRLDGPTEEIEYTLSGVSGGGALNVKVTAVGYKY